MRPRAVLRAMIGILVAVSMCMSVAAAQAADAATGLTVTGFGEASAPAETATVQFGVGMEVYGPPMPPDPEATPGAKERSQVEPILQSLADVGVPDDAITMILSPYLSDVYLPIGGPAVALFRVELNTAEAARITEVVSAAVVGAAQERLIVGQVSVRYGVADCETLHREAREAAIADGRDRATMEADLLDVELGELQGARDASWSIEATVGAFGAAAPSVACTPFDTEPGFVAVYGPMPAFDPNEEPTVTVYAQMEMTFAIAPAAATPVA